MAGYIGTQAVSVNTTSATISDDLAVGDDLTVTDDATIGGTALVTGVLTTTAATVFNGGFTANAASTISTDGNEDTLVLKSNDADANSGPKLQLNRNSANPADGDDLGEIRFSGRNDAGQAVEYLKIYTEIIDASDGTEDGRFTIDTMLAGTSVDRMQFNSAETIFNQDSKNLDFRVESDGNTACLFVDGGEDRVGINEDVPLEELHISGNGNDSATIALQRLQAGLSTQSRGAIVSFNSATKAMCGISFNAGGDNDNGDIQFYATNDNTSSASLFDLDRLVVFGATGTVFNEDSGNKDFRVESETSPHAIFVDASADHVMVGKAAAGLTTNGMYMAGVNATAGTHFHMGMTHTNTNADNSILYLNRQSADGKLIEFRHANSPEGSISVNGATVALNGFSGRHESSGIPANTPVGTVVSTIDALDVYPDRTTDTDGNAIDHLKAGQTRADHAKVKVSDTSGDACVYGVVAEFTPEDKVNVTSVGIGSIRVTGACAKGDLLESNGDGTAKVQSDDIVRSKTIGKITIGNSNTGVKLVSCVMYCG